MAISHNRFTFKDRYMYRYLHSIVLVCKLYFSEGLRPGYDVNGFLDVDWARVKSLQDVTRENRFEEPFPFLYQAFFENVFHVKWIFRFCEKIYTDIFRFLKYTHELYFFVVQM